MNTTVMWVIALISGFLIGYHHVLYPLILRFLSARNIINGDTHCNTKLEHNETQLPTITLIIPCFNEARYIAEKLNNIACIDYPLDRLKVRFYDDGSTDLSSAIFDENINQLFQQKMNIKFIRNSVNRGKVAIINEAVSAAESDLIVLSDASALISIDALQIIANKMNDPKVGVVAATYCFLEPGTDGEKAYWDYQVKIKKTESEMGSAIGVHGALYSFKRRLFKPLDRDIINDDFILPMQIVKGGYRCLYDTDIVAVELEKSDIELDQKRRKRISAGNMQQTLRLLTLTSPKYGATAFNFVSGKFLRTWMPFLLLVFFMSTLALSTQYWWVAPITLLQIAVYGLALIVHNTPSINWNRPVKLIHYLVAGHWANGIGGLRYMCGLHNQRWHKITVETKS